MSKRAREAKAYRRLQWREQKAFDDFHRELSIEAYTRYLKATNAALARRPTRDRG